MVIPRTQLHQTFDVMKLSTSSWFLLAVAKLLLSVPASALGDKKVLLRNVQSLTLRKDHKTTHRRVAAVPQVTHHMTFCVLDMTDHQY